jgi:hypothetical protein
MLDVVMALLSFVESAPRAYRLKASNAAPSSSTSDGTIPQIVVARKYERDRVRLASSPTEKIGCQSCINHFFLWLGVAALSAVRVRKMDTKPTILSNCEGIN